MGLGASKIELPTPELPTEEDKRKAHRKCGNSKRGLDSCKRANANREENLRVCKSLETGLVMCYGELLCKEEMHAQRKCYNTIFNRGKYKGLSHCDPYEEALKAALMKKGMYPV